MNAIIKTHNYNGTNHHEVIVKSNASNNTGPVQVFLDNHLVKFNFLSHWIENNPNKQIVKIVTHLYKN